MTAFNSYTLEGFSVVVLKSTLGKALFKSSLNLLLIDVIFISSSSCCSNGVKLVSFLVFLKSLIISKLSFSTFLIVSLLETLSAFIDTSNISAKSNSNGNWTFLKILDFLLMSRFQKNLIKCTVKYFGNLVMVLVVSYSVSAFKVELCFSIVSFNPANNPSLKKLVLTPIWQFNLYASSNPSVTSSGIAKHWVLVLNVILNTSSIFNSLLKELKIWENASSASCCL